MGDLGGGGAEPRGGALLFKRTRYLLFTQLLICMIRGIENVGGESETPSTKLQVLLIYTHSLIKKHKKHEILDLVHGSQ